MDAGPEPGEHRPVPFPGERFWRGLESLLSAVGLGSPKVLFKLRRARVQWESRREQDANLARGVAYTHKACPGCGRLVERGSARCAYCNANVRWAPGPGLARTLGLSIPHGSVAMAIVGLNLIFYAIATIASANSSGGSLMGALFNPNLGTLYNMGGLEAGSVISGQIWRLWTYQFLHAGAFHIFFNLYALLSLGPATEDVFGPSKTAVLYWVTGLLAGIASFLTKIAFYLGSHGTSRLGITIGASGAIFGLIGLLIGHAIRRGGSEGAYLRSFLMRWALYGLVMGFFLGADNAAHIGGLACGFLLGLIVRDGEPTAGPLSLFWRLAAFAVTGLTIYGFVAAAMAPHMA